MATIYDVRAIQSRLNELGFRDSSGNPIKVDGLFGAKTGEAVRAFKRSIGLKDRPFVGEITWQALMGAKVAPEGQELPWMVEAFRLVGLHELRNKGELEDLWDDTVGEVDPAEIPWCGQFEAHIQRVANPEVELPQGYLSSRNWETWGEECELQFGAVCIFWRGSPRSWTGHMGNYVAETKDAVKLVGGNQSDAVTDSAWLSKSRLTAVRWPLGHPQSRKKIIQDKRTGALSTNEF